MTKDVETQWSDEWDDLSEVEWLAFLYLANELTGAELHAFETSLADNVGAQDALVRMHKIASSVHLAMAIDTNATSTTSFDSKDYGFDSATLVQHSRVSESVGLYRIALVAAFAVVFLGGAYWVTQLMSTNDRFESSVAEVWAENLEADNDPLVDVAVLEVNLNEDDNWLLESALLFDDFDEEETGL